MMSGSILRVFRLIFIAPPILRILIMSWKILKFVNWSGPTEVLLSFPQHILIERAFELGTRGQITTEYAVSWNADMSSKKIGAQLNSSPSSPFFCVCICVWASALHYRKPTQIFDIGWVVFTVNYVGKMSFCSIEFLEILSQMGLEHLSMRSMCVRHS